MVIVGVEGDIGQDELHLLRVVIVAFEVIMRRAISLGWTSFMMRAVSFCATKVAPAALNAALPKVWSPWKWLLITHLIGLSVILRMRSMRVLAGARMLAGIDHQHAFIGDEEDRIGPA